MCDTYCMFIGDCCYDYLMECDKRKLDIDSALTEQSNFYQNIKRYSSCGTNYLLQKRFRYMLQVSSCPSGDDNFKELCEGKTVKYLDSEFAFPWYIPVIARGALFKNVYCAACHEIRLEEVTIGMSIQGVKCEDYNDPTPEFVPFQHFHDCSRPVLVIANRFQALPRFQTPCSCNDNYAIYAECDDMRFKEECHAYSAVIHHNGSKVLLIRSGYV